MRKRLCVSTEILTRLAKTSDIGITRCFDIEF